MALTIQASFSGGVYVQLQMKDFRRNCIYLFRPNWASFVQCIFILHVRAEQQLQQSHTQISRLLKSLALETLITWFQNRIMKIHVYNLDVYEIGM